MGLLNNPQLKFTRKLAYLDRAGDDLPILFLHGSGFSKEVFEHQFGSKVLSDHRLIALDLPGHGSSKDAVDARQTYSYSGFAQEVIDFVDEIDLGDCIVAGWSLGGQIALELINTTSQILGIMAFGAAPAPNGPIGLMQSMHFSKTLLLAGKAEFSTADARYFEKASFGDLADFRFVETLKRTDKRVRPSLVRNILYGYGVSQKSRLETSKVPVCLLHGRHDPLIKTSYMKALSNPMLYTGKAIVFEASGHAPFADAQLEFDRTVRDFCQTVAAGTIAAFETDLAIAS